MEINNNKTINRIISHCNYNIKNGFIFSPNGELSKIFNGNEFKIVIVDKQIMHQFMCWKHTFPQLKIIIKLKNFSRIKDSNCYYIIFNNNEPDNWFNHKLIKPICINKSNLLIDFSKLISNYLPSKKGYTPYIGLLITVTSSLQ